ncbi:BZ3500_MvSof-1268-A1-R1_Chr2-1g04171 [Microbotryum saponariae]|uniref:ATP synthase subunit d, mitochondrial n=1 Tax=Microbotryum saponariae TaxID=289078 RepID=A0A2X0KHQ5_9BASI|nr:BZ3500_MvSof-1268-A1-R1_Chr2-1g04171 [Microbotryum saponariae]SCZ91158.1 BZ3501_MvSof-1269-A2-R1_Chr2-1g03827 [Microbotryum saponariae]
MAAAVVDWGRITTKLGLHKDTLSALSAFRQRAAAARTAHTTYSAQARTIDFEHYRSVLKNKEIVAEGEKLFKSFKPVDYDVQAQLKAIAAFETKASSVAQELTTSLFGSHQVASAKETANKIDSELGDLNSTLKNIENARSFDELTLDDVAKARPEITKAVETMLKKGKWTVPGYTEKLERLLIADNLKKKHTFRRDGWCSWSLIRMTRVFLSERGTGRGEVSWQCSSCVFFSSNSSLGRGGLRWVGGERFEKWCVLCETLCNCALVARLGLIDAD